MFYLWSVSGGHSLLRQSLAIIEKLKHKAGFVNWNKGKRTEFFGLISKKITGKKELKEKGFVVFDLDDI